MAAMNNLQAEYSRCAAFYAIIARCLGDGDPLRDSSQQAGEAAMREAQQTGQSIGMTQDAMRSRVLMEGEAMRRLMGESCVNVSSILHRYARRCQQVMENGDSVLGEYLSGR
jgi:hypothetical protein